MRHAALFLLGAALLALLTVPLLSEPQAPQGGEGDQCVPGVVWERSVSRTLQFSGTIDYIVVEISPDGTISVYTRQQGGLPPPGRTILPTGAALHWYNVTVLLDGVKVWEGSIDPTIGGVGVQVSNVEGWHLVQVDVTAWGCKG